MSAKNYNFSLPAEQARMMVAALAELPYKMAAPTIQSILNQTDEQDKAAAAAEQTAQAATESAQTPA